MYFLSPIANMTRNNQTVLVVIALIIGGTLLLDIVTPLGFAVWLLYVVAAVLTMWTEGRGYTIRVAALCIMLIVMGFFLSPGIKSSMSIFNRLVGAGVLLMVAMVVEMRKGEEKQVRDSEERFRALMMASSDVIYRMNADWTEMRQLRGRNFIPDTEVPNRSWLMKYIPSNDQAYVMSVIDEAIRTKSIFELEHRVLRVDGTLGWTFSRAVPLLDSKGEIFEWFGAATDITEGKRAQEDLQHSEERYRTLFNTMTEGFCVIEVVFDTNNQPIDCLLQEVNPAFEAQTGWRDAQGKRVSELAPDLDRYWFDIYAKVALTGESAHFENRANALNRWYEVSAYRVGELDTRKVAVFFNDITERKIAEDSLIRLNKELAARTAELTESLAKLEVETSERVQAVEALRGKEQMLIQQSRLAAMGEMIGNIAHQWRQPLNTLALTIQELKLSYELGHFTEDFLSRNVASSMAVIQHMSKTIDDFRNYFSPDKEKVRFSVHEAINNVLSLLKDSFNRIYFEIVTESDMIIYGYHNEFAQACLNIVNNAIDALSERRIIDPKVTITIGNEGGQCVVTIADNAGGISEDIIEKIFDPYFTTKGPQHGTGIGLYMSKAIIEKNMGGKLTVRNISQGAQFRIEIS